MSTCEKIHTTFTTKLLYKILIFCRKATDGSLHRAFKQNSLLFFANKIPTPGSETTKINDPNLLKQTYFESDLLRRKSFMGQISFKILH